MFFYMESRYIVSDYIGVFCFGCGFGMIWNVGCFRTEHPETEGYKGTKFSPFTLLKIAFWGSPHYSDIPMILRRF